MQSLRPLTALAAAFGILIGLVLLLAGTGARAFAQQGVTPTPSPGRPPNEPARGLVYDGLALDPFCGRGFRVSATNHCTHGPDPAPFNFRVAESVPPLVTGAGARASLNCDGDGISGYRIQVLYVRASDKADRYNQYLDSFRAWAAEMDLIYQHSAAETGGVRRVRFVHGTDCVPTVGHVTVPTYGDDSFGATIQALEAKGYNRTDRKYLIFMDSNVYCGIGTLWSDDSPGQSNWNNSGPDWGRTDAGCWSASVPAHELNHNLGGVQDSAPNSTAHQNSGGHCSDENDRMCYEDGAGVVMYPMCPNLEHDLLFDCNHDDYFHTDPPAASYLATHWNTANNRFLVSAQPTCFPVLTVTDVTALSAGDQFRVSWTVTGSGCTTVRHTDVHWDTTSHSGEHPSHYHYPLQPSQDQGGEMGEYQSTVRVDGGAGNPATVYFVVHAFLDDAAEVESAEYAVTLSGGSGTATPTHTATVTATPTGSLSCLGGPAAPSMLYPEKKAVVSKKKTMLEWAPNECATSYNVWVRKDSKHGDLFRSKLNLGVTRFASKKMTDDTDYFWRVEACNAVGCAVSRWRKFSVDLP